MACPSRLTREAKNIDVASHNDICKACKACTTNMCFDLNKDLEHTFELPEQFPQTYDGVRFTADAMDCALPISIDPHSGCSYSCLYCFSNNLMRSPDRNAAALQKKIKEGSFYAEWNLKKLEAFLDRSLKDPTSKAMYPLLDAGCPVQLGALGDPFDDLELHSGWAKQAIPLFIKYKQPVRVGTKGGKVLARPEYLNLLEKSPEQFWFAFSCICNDDELISKIDIKAPVTSQRLKAMKLLTDLGCSASLRFRPFLPGVSDAYSGEPNAWKCLIERAKEAGARALSFEYIFMSNTPTDRQKAMNRLMFKAMGRPHFMEEWNKMSGISESCRRGNRLFKYEMTKNARDLCVELGMNFGCSDPHFKEWNTTGNCCFSANTNVLIQHNGVVSMKSLLDLYNYQQKNDFAFKALCNGEWLDATPVQVPYNKKWYKIKLRNGASLNCTDDHIHFTKDGKITTKDLTVGDFMLFNKEPMPNPSQRGSYDMGKLLGIYIADGFGANVQLQKNNIGFVINKDKQDVVYFIEQLTLKLGGNFGTPIEQDGSIRLNIYSETIKAFMQEFVSGSNAKTKQLKPVIWKMSRLFQHGLLEGWSACDGRKRCIGVNGNTSSKELIEDLYKLCVALGMLPSISDYERKTGIRRISRTTCETVPMDGHSYTLVTHSVDSAANYVDKIAYKTDKIYQQIFHEIEGSVYTQVVSIEEYHSNSAAFAYCLKVEDGHRFQLSNGVITHNCGMPEDGDPWFSNWSRRQMSEVIVQARRMHLRGETPYFTYNDWKPEWAHNVRLGTMVALGDWHSHRVKRDVTFGDHMRGKWNNTKHPRGPYHYFGGVLQPVGVDSITGDVIYTYKDWTTDFDKQFHAIRNK